MVEATDARTTTSQRSFAQKRWFSIFGLAPLGVYVVAHLLTVSKSWSGAGAFDAAIAESHDSWLTWLGMIVLLTFIACHAVIGIKLMLKSTPLSPKPVRLRHWQYVLQRLSALGILLFIPAHVLKAKILPGLSGTHETFAGMHQAFALDAMRFATLPVYLLGTLGVAYHLANGLWTSGVTLGFAQGAIAQRRMVKVSIAFFIFLTVLAYGSIFALYRG